MKVERLIIGAGPAGLAVAGRLSIKGLPFTMLEGSNKIASSWHRHYDRLHLHTVKQLSHLPGMPFPAHYPLYVPRELLVDYYETYAKNYGIAPLFEHRVELVERQEDHWFVRSNKGSFLCQELIIATGVNRTAFRPNWPGLEGYNGLLMHSKDYKNAAPFMGKKTLVIGMGNTGAELALDLAEHAVPCSISVRSPLTVVPRDLNGRPVQLTAKKLAKLPLGLGDLLGKWIRRIYFGDLSKYGLPISSLSPIEQLAKTGKTPVIDIGTIKAIKEGKITVCGAIKAFNGGDVHFTDGTSDSFEAVLLATGYRASLPAFIPKIESMLDPAGLPKHCIGTGEWEGLYFVGFDNYKLGGILGTVLEESKVVCEDLALRARRG